ncbi:hypothetical protein EZV62_016530 [Acer yangbiense]|uniref:Uncharacterized protein n=1 Tax=Acer yangbiense TaxID=1000413 RepID=A0A5C7HNX3_9ROSI|nr:hypothetical protein EZV62_016530 [Acer yangbiense]
MFSKVAEMEPKRGDGVHHVDDAEKWVYDYSVDHKGNVPLRARTGVWKASLFIIAIEFSERLSYFGIATSLIIYLTKVIHQDLKTAARSVNCWAGVTTLMPLFGGFIADAYLGRFWTVFVSSIVYLLISDDRLNLDYTILMCKKQGLLLLTMSWYVPSFKACDIGVVCQEPRKVHEVIFFLAIYLVSIGTGGHKPSLESFGADQFDDDHNEERKKKLSFFNWWNFGLCSGLLLGVTVVIYVQEHFSWGAGDIILTAVMATSMLIFIIGRSWYRYRVPTGSPLTPLLQVLVAAVAKRNLPCPTNPDHELYEVPNKSQKSQCRLLFHTKKLKFLDKAAILEDKETSAEKQSPWRLATVTKVEEMKLILNMIPIWIATLPFGVTISQSTTFFIKQGTTLDRKVGNFLIPPASIFALAAIGMIISVTMYEKILVPVLRKATGNERGIKILQRIGIGMFFSIVTMVVAALVERKRLGVVEKNPVQGSLSMSVFWLAPQFLLVGFGDGFTLVGLQEYFYDQVPDSMRSLGIAFYLSVMGAGNFLSSLLITICDHMSERTGQSWFGKDINSSRLDYFYWLLAAMSTLNLFFYVFLARRYSYKNVQRTVAVADCYDGDGAGSSVELEATNPLWRALEQTNSMMITLQKERRKCPSTDGISAYVPGFYWESLSLFMCKTMSAGDKGAIPEENEISPEIQSPWRLATVTKVEEMKLILNMIPVWLATLPFGIYIAQTSTFFIKQGTVMNREISKFVIPSASISAVAAVSMIISVIIYETMLVPMLRKATGNKRGINILPRICIGILFSIATMIVAALLVLAMVSLWWDYRNISYDQVPDSMRSLGIAFYLSVTGAGNFLSSLMITLVDDITGKHGRSLDINSSRLDKFYWLLAATTTVDLFFYVILADNIRTSTYRRM